MPNVDKKCTTHHYACDCREEDIKYLLSYFYYEHSLICECDGECINNTILKLYPELA